MANPIDPKTWEDAEKAYVNGIERSLAAIATRFNLGKRTVEKYASEHDWDAKRRANKVVTISPAQPKRSLSFSEDAPRKPQLSRVRGSSEIDDMEIVDGALASLSAALTSGTLQMSDGEVRYSVSGRDLAACASALIKVLEYRRKINPTSVAALAEMAIELGINPTEFMAELSRQWKLGA